MSYYCLQIVNSEFIIHIFLNYKVIHMIRCCNYIQ